MWIINYKLNDKITLTHIFLVATTDFIKSFNNGVGKGKQFNRFTKMIHPYSIIVFLPFE